MARLHRVPYPGACHHVVNRGASRRNVFCAVADWTDFLDLVGELPARFLVEIHGYCLMSNHFHLLLRTPEPVLGDAMRHLTAAYTQRFHARHGTDGPLFRGRYRAVRVRAQRHLLQVSRYIHLNPVDAGLARRPDDWPHSSYRAFLDPADAPPWLLTRLVLGSFGSIGARRKYRAFVEQGLDPGTRDVYGRSRLRPILGDEDFHEEVRRRLALQPRARHAEVPEANGLEPARAPALAAIARAVSEVFDAPADALRAPSGRHGRKIGLSRGAFVQAARRLGGYRLREIAAWLGYASYPAAARAAERFGRAAESDPALGRRLEEVGRRLEPYS